MPKTATAHTRLTPEIKKDFKKASKQGKSPGKFKQILEHLAVPEPLSARYKDRKLKGEWRDYRECYIEPDWLLIYTITDFELRPARLGSHSELFD